jgi:hypothetical protein
MQATEELRTTRDIVQAVKQHDEKRYSIKVGDEWYSDFGACPVMKSDFVEVAFAMNGRYRNIRNVRVVAVAGSAPRVDRQPTTQPERTAQAVEFVTISPEEEEEIQHALAKKNAAILNESIETARELLTNRGVSDAVTATTWSGWRSCSRSGELSTCRASTTTIYGRRWRRCARRRRRLQQPQAARQQ